MQNFNYDVKLAVTVDNEVRTNIPEADSQDSEGNYYKVGVSCDNDIKGEWDYNAWTLKLDNVVNGTKCRLEFTSTMTQTERDNIIKQGVQIRRNTYRGKDITEYKNLPEDNPMNLYNQIKSGKFDDIYVGDYIVSEHKDSEGKNIIWLIADLDNYLGTGSTALTTHHATIIPAYKLQDNRMNPTNSTAAGASEIEEAKEFGAYKGSEMYQVTLGKELKADESTVLGKYIYPDFQEHVLKYRNLISNTMEATQLNQSAKDAGASSNWSWEDRYLDLMSEVNVYGTTVVSSSVHDIGIDNRQYAIFQLRPELINQGVSEIPNTNTGRYFYWLKGVTNSIYFTLVGYGGYSYYDNASKSHGVRPRFLIGTPDE